MGAFLRFLAFAALLVALLVFVVAPAIASPLLTQMVRDMGLRADDVEVTIESFDPQLLSGRSESVRLRATNAVLAPATIDYLDLTFSGVSFFDRDFERVRGELRGVVVSAGGLVLSVSSVDVNGPAAEAQAAGKLTATEIEQLVIAAAQRAGVPLDRVRFRDGTVAVDLAGFQTTGRVEVQGGALVLTPELGPSILLLQPAPPDPWRLTEAYVTTDGITISGVVDASRLAQQLPGIP